MNHAAGETNKLEQLARLSRLYGRDRNFTIGGGGNTSFKNADRIWVKPSGVFLGGITADGFVELDRKRTRQIMFNTYSRDATERESQVKDDLLACRVDPASGLRPSVETSLHEAIEYDFVVHLHPFVVNALLCSQQSRSRAFELLGDDILYVRYVDPGYVLSKHVYSELEHYRRRKGRDPKIILLENHGIFVGADSPDEIRAIYQEICGRISDCFEHVLPAEEQSVPGGADAVVSTLRKLRGGAFVKACRSPLICHFLDPDRADKVLAPLTPDQIVYCRAHPLYLERFAGAEQLAERDAAYRALHGHPFKVLLVGDAGLFAVDSSEKSARLAADVFQDGMKISYYSHNFGGPHFLTPEQIDFIDRWEVENYRRNVASV